MRTRAGEILTVLAVSVAVGEAQARPLTGSGPAPTPIFSGTEAEVCAFPAVVSLDNGGSRCTGTLVHPKVVLYAAHCGAGDMQIGFGESAGAPAEVVTPSRCVTNPDYTGRATRGRTGRSACWRRPCRCRRSRSRSGASATWSSPVARR